jgi:hypothetical protein
MNFFYRPAITYSPETGEPTVVLRPEIPVRVIGPRATAQFRALVDTGADNTILPWSLAENCGVELVEGKGPQMEVFGGQKIETLFGDVRFELKDASETIRWRTRVQFFAFPSPEEESLVLGHAGFLDFFTAVFDGQLGELSLTPNSDLPAGD